MTKKIHDNDKNYNKKADNYKKKHKKFKVQPQNQERKIRYSFV